MSYPIVSVTGHRPQHLSPEQQDFAQTELARLAVKLRDEHETTWAISGMALGADQWWAHHALLAGLRLWAFVPFPQQPARWHHTDQRRWKELIAHAARIHETATEYSVAALHKRNDEMIAESDLVIAVWRPSKTSGGTASAVAKVRAKHKPLVLIDLDRLVTVRE